MQKQSDIFFSIVIPTFNHAKFLNDSFLSIHNQNFLNWEALILDDGSQDDTIEISNRIISLDPRFSYKFQTNQGLSAARNTGMGLAKGEFLLFLDADDWLEASCLESYSRLIESYSDVDLFRCGYAYWDRPDGRKFHAHLPFANGSIYPDVLTHNIGPCHSILIRRSFAEQLGGFDTRLNSCEDWDFWMRAGKMGAKIVSIPQVLVAYRYVPNSMSRNPRVMYEALTEVSRRAGIPDTRLPAEAKYNQSTPLDYPEIQKKHLITMLGVMLHQGRHQEAVEWYLSEAAKWNWKVFDLDWKRLSSYLSWGYFFEPDEIKVLLDNVKPTLNQFFLGLGNSISNSVQLVRMVMAPQLKKRNHQRWGSVVGGLKNKLGWY